MEVFVIFIAVGMLIYILLNFAECIYGFNCIQNLSDQISLNVKELPSVSIILSALNEEQEIENTILSLLQLKYPHLEIIAVNDRSTDKTPDILNNLQNKYPSLRVLHIKELPKGWFGKNHALYFASLASKSEWLLFTDADVLMHKNTLTKAMSYVLQNKVDHLTIHEKHIPKMFWLKILLLGQYITYSMVNKPWRVRYSWSKKSLGHGAFNLIKKQSYMTSGGHRAIALECLDDLKLGKLIKSKGFKQDTINGRDFVTREWYGSLKEMIKGLEKNCFAFYNYRIIPVIRDSILALFFYIGTFVTVICFTGLIRMLSLLLIMLTLSLSMYVAKQFDFKKRYAFFYPISILLLIYTMWRSIFFTYKNGGVVWRGTLYPLKTLQQRK